MPPLTYDWQVIGPGFKRQFSYRKTALRAAIDMAVLHRGTVFNVLRFDYDQSQFVPFTRAWVHA